jgi:hypothetical protein
VLLNYFRMVVAAERKDGVTAVEVVEWLATGA